LRNHLFDEQKRRSGGFYFSLVVGAVVCIVSGTALRAWMSSCLIFVRAAGPIMQRKMGCSSMLRLFEKLGHHVCQLWHERGGARDDPKCTSVGAVPHGWRRWGTSVAKENPEAGTPCISFFFQCYRLHPPPSSLIAVPPSPLFAFSLGFTSFLSLPRRDFVSSFPMLCTNAQQVAFTARKRGWLPSILPWTFYTRFSTIYRHLPRSCMKHLGM
jgi:hypothetical protein